MFVGLQALVPRQIAAIHRKHDARLVPLREEMRTRFDHQAEVRDVRLAALESDMKLEGAPRPAGRLKVKKSDLV